MAAGARGGHDWYFARDLPEQPGIIELHGDEAQHVRGAARKRQGDEICITDGKGRVFTCRIAEINRDGVRCQVIEQAVVEDGDRPHIVLAVGLIRPQRFDWLVEKAAELGVRELRPLRTRYARDFAAEDRRERWQRIAVSALKQSHNPFLLAVESPISFDDYIHALPERARGFAAHPLPDGGFGPERPADLGNPGTGPVYLAVGPEGGFSDEELNVLGRRGFVRLGLGPTRLRAETAVVVGVGLIPRL